MSNIISAIINLVQSRHLDLRQNDDIIANRANNMGESLEQFVQDMFAGTLDERNEMTRNKKLSQTFAYLGNKTNPPDIMLRDSGDAIEVKKKNEDTGTIALNSSHPKRKLYSTCPKINKTCRDCEAWTERDMLYVVGTCDGDSLKTLCMVYGDEYCADSEVYERIIEPVKDELRYLPNVKCNVADEIGRIDDVDPLSITSVRIRGMWQIQNPLKVFNYIYSPNKEKEFNFMVLLSFEKYNSFDNISELENLVNQYQGLEIKDVMIRDPNNPANLKACKLVTFSR